MTGPTQPSPATDRHQVSETTCPDSTQPPDDRASIREATKTTPRAALRPDGHPRSTGRGDDTGAPAAPESPQAGRLWSLALVPVCLGYFMVILDTTIVNVAVPAASRVVGALGVKGADQCLDSRSYHQQISSRLSGSGVSEDVRDALRREDGVSDGRLEGLVSESGDPDGLVLLLPKAELHSSDVASSPMATCSEEIVQLITACRHLSRGIVARPESRCLRAEQLAVEAVSFRRNCSADLRYGLA
jgi:hypothetical protein